MNIAIEARALTGRGGVRTYVDELLSCLREFTIQDDVTIFHTTMGTATRTSYANNVVVPLASDALLPIWLHHTLPRVIAAAKPNVIHFTKADVPSRKIAPTVVTVHDTIPLFLPTTQSLLRRMYWPRAFVRVAKKSDHIITISEASKSDIHEYLGVPNEKITVTPLAINTTHFLPTQKRIVGMPEKYVLYVGRWDKRKNVPALIAAFTQIAKEIPHMLVVAGKPDNGLPEIREAIRHSGLDGRVMLRADIPYDDLPALYAGADLFVFPSVIEGWGFPPHEAMACGTPVIVSDGAPLPEVVGDAGKIVPYAAVEVSERLVDEEFTRRLADAMQEVLESQQLQEEMAAAGLAQARKNTWRQVAKQTYDVYTKVAL